MPQQIPIVNFPFYDPRSNSGNQQRTSSAIGSIGTDSGIGTAIANIPFRKQQLKLGDQEIARNELAQKQLEAADKEASDNPQILGFRYDFHVQELDDKFKNMEDGKSKEFLGEQISLLKEKRNHFFELGKRGQKISSEEARKEHNELEKLYKGIGKSLKYIDANKLSSGEFSDTADLYKKLAEVLPTITKSETEQMPGVEGQKLLDKSKYAQSQLESKERIAGIEEAGKTERTELSLKAKQSGTNPENAIARDTQTLREQEFSNNTTNEIESNNKRINELSSIIKKIEQGNKVIKDSTSKLPTYYKLEEAELLKEEMFGLQNKNRQLQKSFERINLKKGSVYLGSSSPLQESQSEGELESEEATGVSDKGSSTENVRLGVKIDDLNMLQDDLTAKIGKLTGEPKNKSQEILTAVQMILGGDDSQANQGLNFLKVNYYPLYEGLTKPKGAMQR